MAPTLSRPRRLLRILPYVAAAVVAVVAFVFTHPLVFNESFAGHAHCIALAGLSFETYAQEHAGRYPFSTNGYGDALLELEEATNAYWACYTGPGYTSLIFETAAKTGGHVPEEACGRVYIQGLAKSDNPEIAIFFDKLATPGGDHCHLFRRVWTPLAREIVTIGGGHNLIWKSDWPQFATNQIRLLTEAGIPKQEAERLYAPTLR